MSEQWMGLHHPDWHDSVGVRAWCRCGTWCSDGAECDCCELVELRAEVETLRGRIAEAIALHWDRHDAFDDRYIDCGACNQPAPCLTVQALLGDSND